MSPYISARLHVPAVVTKGSKAGQVLWCCLRRSAQDFSSLRALLRLLWVCYQRDCFCERWAFKRNQGFMQKCAGKASFVGLGLQVCHFAEHLAQSYSF